jgi:hypothetical protein
MGHGSWLQWKMIRGGFISRRNALLRVNLFRIATAVYLDYFECAFNKVRGYSIQMGGLVRTQGVGPANSQF